MTDEPFKTIRVAVQDPDTGEIEELPDDQIVPDDTAPLPPDPEIRTDAVPEDQ